MVQDQNINHQDIVVQLDKKHEGILVEELLHQVIKLSMTLEQFHKHLTITQHYLHN